METLKQCSKCCVTKPLSDFQFRTDTQKYRSECKVCRNGYRRQYGKSYHRPTEQEKMEKVLQIEQQKDLKEIKCGKCLIVKSVDQFDFRKDNQKYRNDCKSCRGKYINEYVRTNTEYKERHNEKQKLRRITDDNFRISGQLRARFRKIINSIYEGKENDKMKFIGCSSKDFKSYITSKFYANMNWIDRNFEFDHIVPISWFDFSKEKHKDYCFNYKNVQPLSVEDHKKKADKVWIEYDLARNPYI